MRKVVVMMRVQVRNGKVIIDGYVNAVERDSKVLYDNRGKFIEKIRAGTFQKALERTDNVDVLLNHEKERKLADTKSGKAKIYEDSIGLRAIVEIDDSEVISKAKENKLRGWSFGFICNKEDRKLNEAGIEERTVRDLDLFEVSIIDDRKTPAYIGTSIELRDDDVKVIEYRTDESVELDIKEEPEEVKEDNAKKIDYSEYEERLRKVKER
jgi:HK97 family phage prohead protease